MNKYDRYLLNQVHIFLAECYENGTIIPPNTIIAMFGKIFNNDITYIKICPNGLENSLQKLVSDINKYMSEGFKSSLKVLLVCYYDTLKYEMMKNKQISNSDKDKYWYKAMISEFVLQSLLVSNRDSLLDQFKVEHANIGILIGNYYKENNTEKNIIVRNMINSKLKDLFFRYNYRFDLPVLCS